jgi:hypothetical protein
MMLPVPASDDETVTETDLDRLAGRVVVVGLVALSVVALVRTISKAAAPIADPDTPWHLVIGHRFLNGMSIRHPGPISPLGFSDWRPRDWSSQILMAGFDDWFGLPGVAWLMGAAIVALGLVQYWNCRRWADPVGAMTGAALGLLVGYNAYSTRPQMVSFVLVAVTLGAVHRMAGDLRARWWLVPLTGLWACVHGLWFMSLVLQGCLFLGLFLDRRLSPRVAGRLAALGLMCLAAVLITPNGWYLALHPLGPFSAGGNYILEFGAPSRHSPSFVLWLVLLGAILVTWLRQGNRRSWVEIGMVSLSGLLALQYLRTIVLGTILLTPYFAAAIETWLPPRAVSTPRRLERWGAVAASAIALVGLAVIVPSTSAGMSAETFPTEFDQRLDQLPQGAVVLNELADGGYLMWRHPALTIVGDGLSDQYSAAWLEGWFGALNAEPQWRSFVADKGVTDALLDEGSPLIEELTEEGWSVQDRQQGRVLLSRP